MEVLITHGWSEENAGDYAIEDGIMKVVDDAVSGDHHFTFYSLFSKRDPRLTGHNTQKTRRGNVSVIPSIWGTPPVQYGTARKALYILCCFLRSLLLIPLLKLGIPAHNSIAAFKRADLVVVKGGTFIYSLPGLRGGIFVLRILLPIMIAVMLGKKVVVAPHSFGPFRNKILDSLIFSYLRKLDWVFCREQESLELLKEKKVRRCSFLPDMAFYHERPEQKEKPGNVIGITARPLEFLNKDKEGIYANYLSSIAAFIGEITTRHPSMRVRLIPQVIGPDPREDDSISLKQIYQSLPKRARERTELLERKLRHPDELVSIYSGIDVLIGTRMHSVIFGLLSGVKPIAISYLGPKHAGIMGSFGLSAYVTGVEQIRKDFLVERTEELMEIEISGEILKKAGEYRHMILEGFSGVLKSG